MGVELMGCTAFGCPERVSIEAQSTSLLLLGSGHVACFIISLLGSIISTSRDPSPSLIAKYGYKGFDFNVCHIFFLSAAL